MFSQQSEYMVACGGGRCKYRAVPPASESVRSRAGLTSAERRVSITGLSKHRIAYIGVTITKSMLWSVDRVGAARGPVILQLYTDL